MRNKIILAGIVFLLGVCVIGWGGWDTLQVLHFLFPASTPTLATPTPTSPLAALVGTWNYTSADNEETITLQFAQVNGVELGTAQISANDPGIATANNQNAIQFGQRPPTLTFPIYLYYGQNVNPFHPQETTFLWQIQGGKLLLTTDQYGSINTFTYYQQP